MTKNGRAHPPKKLMTETPGSAASSTTSYTIPAIPPNSFQVVQLVLPASVVASYQEQLSKSGGSLESLLVERLTNCASYSSDNPIYLDDATRRQLEQILGTLVRDPQALLSLLRARQAISVTAGSETVQVVLPPQLLARIETRRFGRSMSETLQQETIIGLELFVGMR